MSLFNTRFVLPGGYSDVTTEPINSGLAAPTTIGIVGASNKGAMESVLSFSDNETLLSTLGTCEAVDYVRAAWGNGGGLVKFVRVGETHAFSEVFMDIQAGTAVDITEEVSREYDSYTIFDTGAQDWLYVGSDTSFAELYIDFDSGVTYSSGTARTISLEYYDGSTWSSLAVTADGTVSATQTLKQSGAITFTAPADWETTTAPVAGGAASELFWVRLRCSEEAPTAGGVASMVVETKNALPAYGFLVEDATFSGSVQSSATPATVFVHEAGTETNFDNDVEIGDVVTNVSDGSTATIVSIDDGTNTVTTTALSGGYNNGFYPAATEAAAATAHIVSAEDVTSVSYDGTYTTVTCSGATFITSRTAAGDRLINNTDNNTTGVTDVPIVSVLSETTIVVTGDGSGWDIAGPDNFDVQSARVLTATAGAFTDDGIRPNQVITMSGGEICVVQSVIDNNTVITGGLSGGAATHFVDSLTYSYSKAADTYSVAAANEKAYLEAIDPGTDGRNISVEISQSGTEVTVTLSFGGYSEEYTVNTTGSDKLLSIVTDINNESEIVTAEIISGVGNDDMPTSQSATAFIGGSNGSATDADYALGLSKLLTEEDIGIVFVAADYTDAINAALKAHVVEAAGVNYQLPRIAICVKPEDEDFLKVSNNLKTEAQALSYDGRVTYSIQKATISSITSATGLLTSRTAFAASVAGRLAGIGAATPLTAKELNVIELDKIFNRSEKINLIKYGILIADQDANGITVVRSVTPTTASPYYELSVRRAVDVTEVSVRNQLARLYVGRVSEPGILNQIASSARGILDSLTKVPGQPGATLRNWRNIVVSFNTTDSTRIDISYEVLPLSPINFIYTSMFVHSGISFEI